MNLSAEGVVLCVTLEEDFEWEDIFDLNEGLYVDVMLDSINIDVLFPKWKSYVDHDDILSCLRYEEANRFEKIKITFGEGISYDYGEGIYKIENLEIIPAISDNEEEHVVVSAADCFTNICMLTYYFDKTITDK